MGSSKKQTIGYKYLLTVHAVVGHSVFDKITRLVFGDKTAWEGEWTDGEINVDAPGLFGGEEREGGVSGTIELLQGRPDQTQNAFLVARLGPLVSGLRGVVSLIFKNFYWGNNPYLKTWSIRAQRILKRSDGSDQWYLEKAAISGPSTVMDTLFEEDFSEGLAPYTSPSGTLSDFSIVSGGGESVIEIAGTVYDSRVIRTFSGGPLKKVEFDFSMVTIAPDDFGVMDIFDASDNYSFGFVILRELIWSEGLRRPVVNFAGDGFSGGPGTPMGGGAVDLEGEWYSFEATYNPEGPAWDCILRQGSSELDNFSVPVTGPTSAGKLQFRSQGTGGVGRFANIVLTVERAVSDFTDMNPAHIIRECLTDTEWGLGYNDADIDDASFTAAADTLYAEGMGISLLWDRQIPIEDFIKEVLRHIDAACFVASKGDHAGQFVLKLIRNDYDVEDLITLDESSIISVDNWKQTLVGELVNSLTVNYWDPDRSDTGSVTINDPALALQQGGVVNTTQRYEGFTNGTISSRVAERDLRALSQPFFSGTIRAHWDPAAELELGDAFVMSFAPLNIEAIVLRVVSITRGNGKDHEVRIQVTQDVFSMPEIAFVTPPDTDWTDPQQPPEVATERLIFELPYRELIQQLGQTEADLILEADPLAGYLGAAAGQAGAAINAQVRIDQGAGFADFAVLDFAPYASLVADLDQIATEFEVEDASGLGLVPPGPQYAFLGEEAVRIASIAGTTITVGRGVLDTVPAPHPAGTRLFFVDDYTATALTRFVEAQEVDVKIMPTTGLGTLDESLAPVDTITFAQRAFRPYPPGNLRVTDLYNTAVPYPTSCVGELTALWAHRDRLLQSDQLIDATEADIGPEPGVTYNVRWFLDNVLDSSETGLTGTTSTPVTLSGNGVARVEIEAERDGLVSWQFASAEFNYLATPYDIRVVVGGDRRIVVGGDARGARS